MMVGVVLVMLLAGCCVSLPIEQTSKLRGMLDNLNDAHHTSISPKIKCDACKLTVKILHYVFKFEMMSKETLMKVVNYVCLVYKLYTPRICVSAINEFSNEVWEIFFIGSVKPEAICLVALGDECVHKAKIFSSWNITIPKPTKYTPSSSDAGIKKGAGPTMKILQISDTHLDNDYEEGSVADCKEPLCCRRQDGMAGKGQKPAGKYGYPGFCDTNSLMLHSMFQHMVDTHKDVDYILWTGDIPPHNVWNQSRADQEYSINQAAHLIQKYFPGKRVFATLGNHEGVPVNSFPPPEIWGAHVPTDEWLFNRVAEDWAVWLPRDTQVTIKKGGYYTALIEKGLRLVSLNTNYGHGDNWWLAVHNRDPAGQLQWLVGVLLQAEKDGEKVHIIGHVPPNGQVKWWSFNFYKIVDRFQHTITAQVYGHTHHDEYHLFYDMKTYQHATNVAYLGPSVTTYHQLNPGYRVYEMDGGSTNSSLSIVDHHTYILDLAKVQKTGVASWELEYTAKETYGLKNLSPFSWNQLVMRMDEDDRLFQIYYRAFTKQHVIGQCVGQCKKNYLCSIRTAMSGVHNFCNFDKKQRNMFAIWRAETYNKC